MKKGKPLRIADCGLRIQEKEQHQSEIRNPKSAISALLLGLCLCILAIRVTYTESPMAQASALSISLGDTIYSLTLSGILLLGLVVWLLRGLFRDRWAYHATGLEIGLILLIAAGVLSTWTAADKRLALSQISMLVGPILAAILIVQILRTAGRASLVLVVIAALGVVSTYQCIEQFAVSNRVTIEQYEKDPNSLLTPMEIERGTFQNFLLEHRLYSRGVRGFFTTSNSAASFGLMACLAAIALLAERWASRRDSASGGRSLLFSSGTATLLVIGLFLTQSKGGIVAFFAAAGLLAGLMAWRRLPVAQRKTALVIAGAMGLLVAVGVLYAAVSYGMKHGRLPGGNSMLVRWQYWVASTKMIADHPLTGIGPGNFSLSYTRYKPAGAPETVADPHCLPLSLLAQFGPLGLVGFLALLLIPLARSLSPLAEQTPLSPACWSTSQRSTLLALAGLSACLLIVRPILIPSAGGDSIEMLTYSIVSLYLAPAAAFLIGFLLLVMPMDAARGAAKPQAGPIVVGALGCAVFGVLLHSLIDFAMFEPGVWMAFWIVMACLICLGRREAQEADARNGVCPHFLQVAGVVGGAAVLVGYGVFIWLPVFRTTANIQQARDAASAGQLDAAHRLLDAAAEADPLSTMALSLNGNLYLQQYDQEAPKQPILLRSAIECFEQAIRVNAADYKSYEKMGIALSSLRQDQAAYDSYAKAVNLYPGNERLWLLLGRAADRMGKRDTALAHYRKAVEVEDAFRAQFKQMYPKWKTPVSRLGEADYQLALKRIKELAG